MKALPFGYIQVTVVVLSFCFHSCLSPITSKGIRCFTNDGVPGTWRGIRSCPSALELIRRKIEPEMYRFRNIEEPVVCCVGSSAPLSPADRITAMRKMLRNKPPSPTTTSDPLIWSYGQCEPIPAKDTARKTGQRAYDKCIEYQEKYVYPCKKSKTGKMKRHHLCNWRAETLITDGEDAYEGEFPHMALLGYGETRIKWLCDGMLISEWFILTAAHCTKDRWKGNVTQVKIGIQRRSEMAFWNQYRVLKTYPHPRYRSPHKNDDIALLRTARRMRLDAFARPICIHTGTVVNDEVVVATGWGRTDTHNMQSQSDNLKKVSLYKFTDMECDAMLQTVRLLPFGYDPMTQVCYGDRRANRDTCQGDSGGPLQIRHPKVKCMYLVLAVIWFGKNCGVTNEPGSYIRVAPYVRWIESIAWPRRSRLHSRRRRRRLTHG
ncbi:serine protease snake-like [Maniola jurtina]|uniref:serine protease snake-like n=1 Tax=Maniola jurtina TaxID=191418 RepID=UPI001E689C82|nr:serine protease snake-like [Maniola jurtina]